jgi:protein O-mannosyl-transferase
LNVESVAWGAERKSVLSMFFFMLTLLAYQWYTIRHNIWRYLAVVTGFTLGLLAKPQIVTLPFVLLLWDIWPLKRWPEKQGTMSREKTGVGWLVLEKVPLLILAAVSSILTLRAQSRAGTVGSLTAFPVGVRIENALIAYVQYIWSAFWPFRLAVLYPYPSHAIPVWQTVCAVTLLLGITAFVIVEWKRRYLAVGWFWYAGTLIPMIGLVQVGLAARADRYMYLPAIGLFVAVVWGASDWVQENSISKSWLTASAAVVLTLLAALTVRQVGYWRDGETLWKHTLQVTSDNAIAEANLGTALLSLDRGDEALEHFQLAVTIDPENFLAQLFIGISEGRHGNPQGAIEHLQIALQRPAETDMVEMAYSNLGNAYRNLHDYEQAKQNFAIALAINPKDPGAAIGMGLIAQHDKNLPAAIQWYSQSTLGRPNAVASLLLANAMEKNGQIAESRAAYEQAAKISKDLAATKRVVEQMLTNLD